MVAEVAVALLLLLLSYQWWTTPQRKLDLPRVGPPTIFGYLYTALRFVTQSNKILVEGRNRFSGQPFVIPTSTGSLIVVGPDAVEFLQQSDDTVFSQSAAIDELLTTAQTADEYQTNNPYHAAVVRTDLTRAIPSLLPELHDEMVLTISEKLNAKDGSESVTVPAMATTINMIGRISNRVLVGTPLCRNPEYIRAMVRYAETVILFSRVLRWCPSWSRDAIYSVLQSLFGGKQHAFNFLVPFVQDYLQKREDMEDKPNLAVEYLVRAAPPEELANPVRLGMRVLSLNFASTHTSSLFTTHTLIHLAALPQAEIDAIRIEIQQALKDGGGWTKDALSKFWKLDSMLREVGRFHALSIIALSRRTIQDGTLPDGTFIPKGYTVAVDLQRVHRDPNIYPNPEVFDPYRFSKLRENAHGGSGLELTNVGKNFLSFGTGRHACPGRFFASAEIKMILAYLVLNYDIAYPEGKTLPPSLTIDAVTFPDPKVELVFKKR